MIRRVDDLLTKPPQGWRPVVENAILAVERAEWEADSEEARQRSAKKAAGSRWEKYKDEKALLELVPL
jgi:hypothetical protein